MLPIPALIATAAVANALVSPQMDKVVAANNAFGEKLFAKADSGQGNHLLSPISVTTSLRLLLVGARGTTRASLAQTLELSGLSDEQVEQQSIALAQKLTDSKENNLSIANSIWVAADVSLDPGYVAIAKDKFASEVQPLTGVEPINAWVSDHTKGRITRLFQRLDPKASMVLANAVAFDGKWQLPFPKRATAPRVFHGALGDKQVQTMSVIGEISSIQDGGTEFVKLPYQGTTSLWIAMPAQGTDPAAVLHRLLNPPTTTEARATLFLPKFTFEDQFDLRAALSELGLQQMFVKADLKGISTSPALRRVSQVVHKTYIKVDEEGTEAAAATGIVMSRAAIARPLPAPEIHIDRPFALAIRDDATGTLLFVGVVRTLE